MRVRLKKFRFLFGLYLTMGLGGCVTGPALEPVTAISEIQNVTIDPAQAQGAEPQRPKRDLRPQDIPSPSSALVDQVFVFGQSLSGYWVVEGPSMIDYDIGLFSGVRISYGAQSADRNICLIHDQKGDLTATCSAGTVQSATGAIKGQALRLVWWGGPGTLIFTGTRRDPKHVDGNLTGGILGLGITGAIPTRLRKLDTDGPTIGDDPDRPGAQAMARVLDDLAKGAPSRLFYSDKGLSRFADWQHLDGVPSPHDARRFLGTVTNRWRPKQPETKQDVFRISTATGTALCRVGLNENGLIADFDCRTVAL